MSDVYKNILIVRTDKIGDIVLTLPLAKIIKKHFPKAKVTFLVKEYTKALAKSDAYVDEVLTLKYSGSLLKIRENVAMLKTGNYDAVVTVYPRFRLSLILLLSGIKTRIGTGYRWYSFLFNKKVYEHRKYGTKHELDHNIKLLEKLEIYEDSTPASVEFSIQTNDADSTKVDKFLHSTNFSSNKKSIIIHPGSGGSAVDWPVEHFKSLINILAHQLDVNIIITGSPSELDLCNSIAEGTNAIITAGKFSLNELTALIDKTDILVANSTGPIHVAAALKKWVIGFYPKIAACSPVRWGPYTEKKIVYTPNIKCESCTRKQCEELGCMKSIDPVKVAEDIKNLLTDI